MDAIETPIELSKFLRTKWRLSKFCSDTIKIVFENLVVQKTSTNDGQNQFYSPKVSKIKRARITI